MYYGQHDQIVAEFRRPIRKHMRWATRLRSQFTVLLCLFDIFYLKNERMLWDTFFSFNFRKKKCSLFPTPVQKIKNMIDFFFSRTSFPQKVYSRLLFHWAIYSLQFTEHRPKVLGLHVDGPQGHNHNTSI